VEDDGHLADKGNVIQVSKVWVDAGYDPLILKSQSLIIFLSQFGSKWRRKLK